MAPTTLKQQYSCISVEDIVPGVQYTLNLNPCDARQSWDKLYSVRFDECLRYISMILHDVKMYARARGYMEISKGGRFHFHGRIEFKDVKSIFMFFCEIPNKWQRVCTYEMDKIEDDAKWEKYITKQDRFYTNKCNYIDTKEIGVLPDGCGNMKVRHTRKGKHISKSMKDYDNASD